MSFDGGGVNGGFIRPGASTTTCDGTIEGAIRWNTTDDVIEVCNGTDWQSIVQVDLGSSDDVPDAWSFTDVTGQSLSALILSNTINLTGFDGPILTDVTGAGTPELRVNGGAWVTAAPINPGDTLQIRQLSSASVSTARTAVVNVGSTSDNWNATTRAGQLRIFRTAGTYNGNLGGLSGADAICQSEAGVFGYSGTWKAILSDTSTNAKDRLTLVYPIVRAASPSTVVESTDLWAAALENAVTGTPGNVWSGTINDGTKHADTCTDWTSASGGVTAIQGNSDQTSHYWIINTWQNCNVTLVFYCIEQ